MLRYAWTLEGRLQSDNHEVRLYETARLSTEGEAYLVIAMISGMPFVTSAQFIAKGVSPAQQHA